jgi:hypothetical protein
MDYFTGIDQTICFFYVGVSRGEIANFYQLVELAKPITRGIGVFFRLLPADDYQPCDVSFAAGSSSSLMSLRSAPLPAPIP